ncbi:hypothetical protein Tco_0052232 [Tanacetum coccineum]
MDEILKKFGFLTVKTASTPMETSKPLMKDENAEDVDAYTDSDYAGASLDRKSTTGGTICIVKNLVFHPKTKHNEIIHHFIRDSNEKKLIQMIKVHTDQNVADLLTKAFDVGRFQYLIATNDEIQVSAISLTYSQLKLGPVVQGEGSTHPVESHHTPTSAPSTSQPPVSLTSRRTTKQESMVPQPRSPTQTPVADEAASTGVDVRYRGATTTVTGLEVGQGSGNIDKTLTMPHDSPLPRVNTLGSDKGSMTLQELITSSTLSKKVESLETELQQTKLTYGDAYTKLIKKVKKLENKVKSSQARRRARIIVSDDEDDLEDPSKQGRNIAEIDQDPVISLVQHDVEIQGRHEHDIKFDFDIDAAKDVSTAKPVSTAGAAITTTSVVAVSTVSPRKRVSTADDITMAETLVYIRKSAAKDKGKGKMDESETIQTKTKLQQEQERLVYEAAVRLQVELEEEKRQRIAKRLQAEEREMYTEAEQARILVEFINQRKRYFAAQKAKERRNKPPTQAQQRTYMSNYIKHIGGYTLQQLRVQKEMQKKLDQEGSKRQKTGESSEPAEEPKDKEEELSQEKLQQMMIIVPEQGINVEDMDDLVMMWSLVKENFKSTEPTDDKEREIWVELKRLFEPDTDDELWKLQKHIHDLTWRLYDLCGVHHVSIEKGIDIYMLVEKEYPLSRGTLTQMLVAKLLVDQDNEMSRELLRKIFMQAERPRR